MQIIGGTIYLYIQNDKTSTTSFQHHSTTLCPWSPPWNSRLHDGLHTPDVCRLELDDPLDDSRFPAETLSLQIFKELLLLLEVPRKILRLLTTNLNQLVINLEVRVSCNMCFLFMGHGSSCIMMNEEFSTAGARSGSNSFVCSMSFRQLSLSLLPKWSCDLYPPWSPPRWTPSRQRATLRFWY